MLLVPVMPSAVSPHWLNQALRSSVPDLPPVESIDWELVGQGFGLTGVVARLRPRYQHGAPGAPASLILKLPMAMPESASQYREAQSLDAEATLRYYTRCAHEVDFYRAIASEIPDVAPYPFFVAADESERVVVILLEDLEGARSGDVLAGCNDEETRAVVEQIARVHTCWWERETPDWLPRWGGNHDSQQQRLAHQIAPFLDRWGQMTSPEIVAITERLGACYAALLEAFDRQPRTVIHADLHLDNVLFDVPDRRVPVILDWQSVCCGPAIIDVGPFMAGSLLPDDRRRHESELLMRYRARLLAGGVRNYSADELWFDYRLSLARMLAGIVGWLANADLDRLEGRERLLVEAALGDGRLTAALVDHDILGLLNDL